MLHSAHHNLNPMAPPPDGAMLYIHVPFCRTRCIYCDFYSTTCGSEVRDAYVQALCRELQARRGELPNTRLATLYLGGGTPSQLAPSELTQIFAAVRAHYDLLPGAEITLEANPDDVTPQWVDAVQALGVNRVSLGVQSFHDALLRTLRRRHTARQATEAVQRLCAGGIGNISIDLMYGLPEQDAACWQRDVWQALQLPVTHLSAYALMVEEGTPLAHMVQAGTLRPADDEATLAAYEHLMDAAAQAGFEHYEISNFCRPGYASRHNSGYWHNVPYLGCGPGAHSYDGLRRSSNLPDVHAYAAAQGDVPHATEELTPAMRFDERVFTALRTSRGLDVEALQRDFGAAWTEQLKREAARHVEGGRLTWCGALLRFTRQGLFVSDDVMSDLMHVD